MKSNPLSRGPGDTQPSAQPLDERAVLRWYGDGGASPVVRDREPDFERAARKPRPPPPSVKILPPPELPESRPARAATVRAQLPVSAGWYVAGLLATCLALSALWRAERPSVGATQSSSLATP